MLLGAITVSAIIAYVLVFTLVRVDKCSYSEREERDDEYGKFYEGDMRLHNAIYKGEFDDRNGLLFEKYRWPNKTVPYKLSKNHTQEQNDFIEHALRTIESVSCVKFVRRTNQSDYVKITAYSIGCFSQVGHQGGVQILNLKRNELGHGCFRLGTIMHEFLHVLGFYHMQSAFDRDEYVTIVEANIVPKRRKNFNKYTILNVSHFGTTYDYGSVMHYGPKAFSRNGCKTILPKDMSKMKKMGQRLNLSETDILKLNRMYECLNAEN